MFVTKQKLMQTHPDLKCIPTNQIKNGFFEKMCNEKFNKHKLSGSKSGSLKTKFLLK